MFKNSNPYRKLKLKHIFDMHEQCPVCKQRFDLEPGFWYGTGFVSYGLAVLISAISFVVWYFMIGISTDDNRVLYWILFNAILLVILQPWLMRLSRSIYIRFFVFYDPKYHITKPKEFE